MLQTLAALDWQKEEERNSIPIVFQVEEKGKGGGVGGGADLGEAVAEH